MESHTQQLASLRLSDDDDDGTRDWASLPLDLLKICIGAPPLEHEEAAKLAALASCKGFGRAVVRTSKHELDLRLDRRAPFARSTRVWKELWGEETAPQHGQDAILRLYNVTHISPERCLNELLSADQRMAFVTTLIFQVRACTMPPQQHSAC